MQASTITLTWDRLRIGDIVLVPSAVYTNAVDVNVVRSIRLVGDDIVINEDGGEITSSRSNAVSVLVTDIGHTER